MRAGGEAGGELIPLLGERAQVFDPSVAGQLELAFCQLEDRLVGVGGRAIAGLGGAHGLCLSRTLLDLRLGGSGCSPARELGPRSAQLAEQIADLLEL